MIHTLASIEASTASRWKIPPAAPAAANRENVVGREGPVDPRRAPGGERPHHRPIRVGFPGRDNDRLDPYLAGDPHDIEGVLVCPSPGPLGRGDPRLPPLRRGARSRASMPVEVPSDPGGTHSIAPPSERRPRAHRSPGPPSVPPNRPRAACPATVPECPRVADRSPRGHRGPRSRATETWGRGGQ